MNNDDILNLANDFGYQNDTRKEQELWSYILPVEKLIAFANACEKIGMEKAAKICEQTYKNFYGDSYPCFDNQQECADAIRKAIE